MKKFISGFMVFVFLSTLSLSFVYAKNTGGSGPQNTGSGTSTQSINAKLQNPFKGGNETTIQGLFKTIISNILIPIGAVLAVLAFIFAGFMYVTAAGDETKIKKAHQSLLYAAIGTAILLGAGVIVKVLEGTIDQLQ